MRKWNRFVLKVGSSTLTRENGKLNLKLIHNLVRILADLKNEGLDIVLVTSGAIAVGLNKIGLKKAKRNL